MINSFYVYHYLLRLKIKVWIFFSFVDESKTFRHGSDGH